MFLGVVSLELCEALMAPQNPNRSPQEAAKHLNFALKVLKFEDPAAPEGVLLRKAKDLEVALGN